MFAINHSDMSKQVRRDTLDMVYRSGSPHIGSSFSVVEILVALYFGVLRVFEGEFLKNGRDRFILSKGHACPALYATLRRRGILSEEVLEGFARDGGTLEQHARRNVGYGIEVSTGSLGHGLSIGAGMAIAGKVDCKAYRVFVLLSDGEADEGSTWEAALFGAQHRLDNLIGIVDYNKMQALGKTEDILDLEPFSEKWRSFGWGVREVDGHDVIKLDRVLREIPFEDGKPSAIIAHTVKGKGVSFMENDPLWHYRCPDEEEYKKAIHEIG